MVVLQLFLTMVLLQSIVKYSNDFAASKGANQACLWKNYKHL